jgi:hypothetical protein
MGRVENDLAYLRLRAEEARIVAENMRDPRARTYMLSAARSYERLAERAEESCGLARGRLGARTIKSREERLAPD